MKAQPDRPIPEEFGIESVEIDREDEKSANPLPQVVFNLRSLLQESNKCDRPPTTPTQPSSEVFPLTNVPTPELKNVLTASPEKSQSSSQVTHPTPPELPLPSSSDHHAAPPPHPAPSNSTILEQAIAEILQALLARISAISTKDVMDIITLYWVFLALPALVQGRPKATPREIWQEGLLNYVGNFVWFYAESLLHFFMLCVLLAWVEGLFNDKVEIVEPEDVAVGQDEEVHTGDGETESVQRLRCAEDAAVG